MGKGKISWANITKEKLLELSGNIREQLIQKNDTMQHKLHNKEW